MDDCWTYEFLLCSCESSEKRFLKQDNRCNGGNVITVISMILRLERDLIYHGGDDSREDPPVPIPNTEVKLSYAESTQRDTAREDR